MEKGGVMIKRLILACLALLMMYSLGVAKGIVGVTIPDTLAAGKETLILNGAGVRTWHYMKMYVAGLYLKEKNNDPQKIIDADEPMAIRLHIVSNLVTGERMAKATNEGFIQSTGGNTAPIRDKIDKFIAVFKEGIRKNDVYDIVYLPEEGVTVFKNGSRAMNTTGLVLKKALFGTWLCENPSHKCPDLKKGMLGE